MSNIEDIENVRSFLFEFKDGTELRLVEKENYDKLVKRIKELEEENSDLRIRNNSRIVGTYAEVRLEEIIKDEYISKQKVKDKIEELKKDYEDSKDENGETEYYYPDYTIRKLEELLEEK